MGVGNLGGGNDFFARGVGYTKGNVVEKRVVEENCLLIDVANQAAQVGNLEVANVFSVNRDATCAHVVEAWE